MSATSGSSETTVTLPHGETGWPLRGSMMCESSRFPTTFRRSDAPLVAAETLVNLSAIVGTARERGCAIETGQPTSPRTSSEPNATTCPPKSKNPSLTPSRASSATAALRAAPFPKAPPSSQPAPSVLVAVPASGSSSKLDNEAEPTARRSSASLGTLPTSRIPQPSISAPITG